MVSATVRRTVTSAGRSLRLPRLLAALPLGLGLLAGGPAAGQSVRGIAGPIYQPNIDALIEGGEGWLAGLEEQGWFLRGQATTILQGKPRMPAAYSAEGSLTPKASWRNTESFDVALGRRLWENAELVAVPTVTRGFGLSNARGVAAFPSGEAFRLGTRDPYFAVSRLFVRQTIDLSFDAEGQDSDPLRFTGPLARERITITAGKVSVWDFFDDNRYAHDARTQFMNWAHVGAAGFDFAADARGYTNGLVLEWEDGTWAVRQGTFMVARRANGLALDDHFFRGWQVLAEVDRFWYALGNRPGALRIFGGAQRTNSARWNDLTAALDSGTPYETLRQYRVKPMVGGNVEQEVNDTIGIFGRASWNDGRTQNWHFTEQTWSLSAGVSANGYRWQRPNDTVGVAGNIGGISAPLRRYLAAGGQGFITGDGALRYGREKVLETYYDAQVTPGLNVAANVQLIANPAYNRDRGPAAVFALRARVAF